MHLRKKNAQGTIEYLVIIAVVVVIGLIVVSMLANFTGQGSQITSDSVKIGSASAPISVTNSAVDISGNGLLTIGNNTGENVTITKVKTGDLETSFNQTIPSGSQDTFSLSNLGLNCACESTTAASKECEFTIYTTSQYGIVKSETIKVIIDCVQSAKASDSRSPVVLAVLPDINTCAGFGFTDGTISCLTRNGPECTSYDVNNCYNDGNINEIYDPSLNGTDYVIANDCFQVPTKFCSGGASSCVGKTISILSGPFQGSYSISESLKYTSTSGHPAGSDYYDTYSGYPAYYFSADSLDMTPNYLSTNWPYKLYGPNTGVPRPVCGNGVRDGNEECDGSDFAFNTCTMMGKGYVGGTLACSSECTYNHASDSNNVYCIPPLTNCTPSNPCEILSCEHLAHIGDSGTSMTGSYYLNRDIDCNKGGGNIGAYDGFEFTRRFTGTLDGRNHTIYNLFLQSSVLGTIWWTDMRMGLFRYVDTGGLVKDLNLVDSNVNGSSRVGSVSGEFRGTLNNVHVTGRVYGYSSSYSVGGLVGRDNGGTFINSTFTGPIEYYTS
ncbi:MAG: hypothetical protein AABW59_01195 [archaeon]